MRLNGACASTNSLILHSKLFAYSLVDPGIIFLIISNASLKKLSSLKLVKFRL